MQRYNFQFTGQRFYRIEDGRLAGQLRDVAYQATTTDFWRSMEAVGGPQTYVLGGAFNCGKAQPGPGRAGHPRVPQRPCSAGSTSSTPQAEGSRDDATPHDLVEQALSHRTTDAVRGAASSERTRPTCAGPPTP